MISHVEKEMMKHEMDLNYLYRLWIKCEDNTSLFSNPLFEEKGKKNNSYCVRAYTWLMATMVQEGLIIGHYSHDIDKIKT